MVIQQLLKNVAKKWIWNASKGVFLVAAVTAGQLLFVA